MTAPKRISIARAILHDPKILILDEADRLLIEENMEPIMRLASISELRSTARPFQQPGARAVTASADLDLRIIYEAKVDRSSEIAKLKKEIDRLAKDIESKKSRLADESFLSKAPAKVVEDLKATLAARTVEHQKLLDRLAQLE